MSASSILQQPHNPTPPAFTRGATLDPALAAEVESVLSATATPVLQAMSRAVIRGTDFDRAIERELSRRFEAWMGRGTRQRAERVEEV